ncbi:MAG: endonuclease/exonuclease/phosphatase [Candidatus Thermoplasmatota archaeon]|jgi:endonuclease/exonuclease/phosphatase family metal-dependent hydrolase
MAPYSPTEWKKIRAELAKNPTRYGLPSRRDGSVLLASFNIRKLGEVKKRSKETWDFFREVLSRFDLIAVQEVMNNVEGLVHLKGLLGKDYGLITSDVTGAFTGEDGSEEGMAERLAFLFNWRNVERTEIATDVSCDRTQLLSVLFSDRDRFHAVLEKYRRDLDVFEQQKKEYKEGRRPRAPSPPHLGPLPQFLDFIRTPYQVGFRVLPGKGSKAAPYEFTAVNAHLNYGNFMEDRWQDFEGLLDWLLAHVQDKNAYYRDCILLGDLNLDFDDPETDRIRIEQSMKGYNVAATKGISVNFPFLDPHKGQKTCFRTNARLTETFDQIGLFFQDKRWPKHDQNSNMPMTQDGPDYGVFDFVNLFAVAIEGEPYSDAWPSTKKKAFFARFEFEVSDHMPLWLRVPKP